MAKKVLIVVANAAVHPTLNYPVGFWASELFHPIEVFNKAGIEWQICSPNGGKVIMDPYSNPNDESQYAAWDTLSKKYVDDPKYMELLENTPSISALNLDDFDAIMVAGGQSPMFTFDKAFALHEAFLTFYEHKKVTAALCHGASILNYVKDANGNYLVSGKTVTGFTDEEEEHSNQIMQTEVMPWRIEDELIKKGAKFAKLEAWKPYTVADENLITGQQNMSGEVTALKIVELLNQKS